MKADSENVGAYKIISRTKMVNEQIVEHLTRNIMKRNSRLSREVIYNLASAATSKILSFDKMGTNNLTGKMIDDLELKIYKSSL